jgi:hypothetical protein
VLIPDTRHGKEDLGPQTGFRVADHRDGARKFNGVLRVRGVQFEEISFDFENGRITGKK